MKRLSTYSELIWYIFWDAPKKIFKNKNYIGVSWHQ